MTYTKVGKTTISKAYLAKVSIDEAVEHLSCISEDIVRESWIQVNGKPKPKPRKKKVKPSTED